MLKDKWNYSFVGQGPNKEEILKKFKELHENYFKGDIEDKQYMELYKELKIPDKFAKDALSIALNSTLEKTGLYELQTNIIFFIIVIANNCTYVALLKEIHIN